MKQLNLKNKSKIKKLELESKGMKKKWSIIETNKSRSRRIQYKVRPNR